MRKNFIIVFCVAFKHKFDGHFSDNGIALLKNIMRNADETPCHTRNCDSIVVYYADMMREAPDAWSSVFVHRR